MGRMWACVTVELLGTGLSGHTHTHDAALGGGRTGAMCEAKQLVPLLSLAVAEPQLELHVCAKLQAAQF